MQKISKIISFENLQRIYDIYPSLLSFKYRYLSDTKYRDKIQELIYKKPTIIIYLAEASLDTYDMHDRRITSIPRYTRHIHLQDHTRRTAWNVYVRRTDCVRRTRSAIHTKLAWQQAGGRLRGKVGPLPQLFYPRHIFITKLSYISPRRADLRAHEPMLSPPA